MGADRPPVQTIRKGHRLVRWVLLAIALHLELGLGLGIYAYFYAPRAADRRLVSDIASEDSIDFGVIDEEASRKIIAELEVAEEKQEEEEKRKEEETIKPSGQVVEMARPRNEQRPDEARFVSEYDSKVAKEIRKFGELNQKAVQGAQDGKDEATTPPSPGQAAQAAQQASPAGAGEPVLAMRTPPTPENAAQKVTGMGPAEVPGNPLESEPGAPPGDGRDLSVGQLLRTRPTPQVGGGAGTPEVAGAEALMPTQQQVARAIGSGTSDHLEGIEEGAETALNAKKWKFASFFNRVKQQVREQWRPADEYRKRDPNFRIYGQRDRFTLLRVELKPDGSLANVAVESPSGVEFLDDEAIEAFKLAQPFPNPPYQLIEKGAISFGFGFFFEIGGGPVPRMKTFRYNDF